MYAHLLRGFNAWREARGAHHEECGASLFINPLQSQGRALPINPLRKLNRVASATFRVHERLCGGPGLRWAGFVSTHLNFLLVLRAEHFAENANQQAEDECQQVWSPPLVDVRRNVPVLFHALFAEVQPIDVEIVAVPWNYFLAFTALQDPINFRLGWLNRGLRVVVVMRPLVDASEAHSKRPPFQLLRANTAVPISSFVHMRAKSGSRPASLFPATPIRYRKLSMAVSRYSFMFHQPFREEPITGHPLQPTQLCWAQLQLPSSWTSQRGARTRAH